MQFICLLQKWANKVHRMLYIFMCFPWNKVFVSFFSTSTGNEQALFFQHSSCSFICFTIECESQERRSTIILFVWKDTFLYVKLIPYKLCFTFTKDLREACWGRNTTKFWTNHLILKLNFSFTTKSEIIGWELIFKKIYAVLELLFTTNH